MIRHSKIGLLGGMGPIATGAFYQKLIKSIQSSFSLKSTGDYPQILINSIPIGDLIGNNISDNNFDPIVNGLKELDNFKPDYIAIICNTANTKYELYSNNIDAEILDLRKGIEDYLRDNEIHEISLFGTSYLLNSIFYNFEGVTIIKPSSKEVKIIEKAILKFNTGTITSDLIDSVKNIIKRNEINKKSHKTILGCTEISLMLENNEFRIDPMDILISLILDKLRKDKEN